MPTVEKTAAAGPSAPGGPAPKVYQATVEQLDDGLGRMCPTLGNERRRLLAIEIKRINDQAQREAAQSREDSDGRADQQAAPRTYPQVDPRHPPPERRSLGPVDLAWLERETPPWIKLVWSFLGAVIPWQLGFRARTKTIQARRAECGGDQPCEMLHQGRRRPGLYCAACGCGESPRSNLATKTTMPLARCPLGKWPGERRRTDFEGPSKAD